MANVFEPDEGVRAEWESWLAGRPEAVREVARRFEPWRLYRLRSTGHRVVVSSLSEHESGLVTLTVDVLGRFNVVVFERRVFGIDPADLEECDLPGPDELVGTLTGFRKFSEVA